MNTFNLNIPDIFKQAIEQKSSKAFIVVDKQTITYGDLKKKIGQYTSYFIKAGIKKGDKIVFSSKDESFICLFYISLLANGITTVLIDANGGAERSNAIIGHCKPKSVFADEELLNKWELKSAEYDIVPIISQRRNSLFEKFLKKENEINENFPACINILPETNLMENIDAESDAYILFTSGTTSVPKGVRISFRALFSHLQTLKNVYQLSSGSKIFNNMILSHADGMIQGPLLTLFSRATLYRPFLFSIQKIEEIFDIVYRESISHWIMVPTMMALIYQFKHNDPDKLDTKEFKYVISCGAKLEAKLWSDFENKFNTRIINGYGLTETVAGGLFAGPDERSHVIGTIGLPADCDARIFDDKGNELPAGEKGEIWLRGSLVMSGYLNAKEATDEVFSGEWLKTGDIGYKGDDGCFRIVGRKKNIIISGGFNISPEEVTEVIKTYPAVQDAVTFGMADDIWGENVVSSVVVKQGSTLDKEEIIDYCRQHLEERKIPSKVFLMNSLPCGVSGKVIVSKVREQISNLQQQNETSSELKPAFMQIVSKCLQMHTDRIHMDMLAHDTPAWDSLSHLVLIGTLEKHFSITFTPLEVMRIKKLSDLFVIVENKLKK